MKRKLALLLLVLLALTVVFAACNNPEDTTEDVRWNKETHVFHVSLADFVGANGTGIFNAYDKDGKVVTGSSDSTYRKDKALSNETFSKDEVVPIEVYGTYKLTIDSKSDVMGRCEVKGEQVLYLQYMLESTVQGETVDLTKWNGEDWQDLELLKADDDEVRENTNLELKANTVVLKSTTTTVVEFVNQTQQPISSRTTVDGFYLGKANRQVTKYDVSTEYDFSDAKKPSATVTLDDNDPKTYELANSAVKLIDANQLLVYVRSLSKTEGSLQDGHSAIVFDPLTGKTQTVSFVYTYNDKMILTDGNNKLCTNVNAVGVSIGGTAFMLQENVPQTVKADTINVGGVTRAKLTTLHFRVGYLSYEIEYSNEANAATNWSAIWEALTPKAEESQDE